MRSALALLAIAASLGAFYYASTIPYTPAPKALAQNDDAQLDALFKARIDFHTHISPRLYGVAESVFAEFGSRTLVNLTGLPDSPSLDAHFAQAAELNARGNLEMVIFTGIDWRARGEENFAELAAASIERAVNKGAKGVKISKALGLGLDWPDGSRMAIDDPKLSPIFERIEKLGIPVAIHVADPVAFWEKPDPHNERFDELKENPNWGYFSREDVPSHREIFNESVRLFKRHPKLQFVSVHVGGFPENLDEVERLLSECPNVSVDIAARVPELGRVTSERGQRFFERFQDRILFGTDFGLSRGGVMLGAPLDRPETKEDVVHFFASTKRYLHTLDKGFAHPTPIQGRWTIDGVGLPLNVLEKIYRKNAERLLGRGRN